MALLPIHIIAGLAALASGAVALGAPKGGKLHRKSGLIFVYAMVVLALTGAGIGAMKDQAINVVAGGLALYLVVSALFAARHRARGFDWKEAGVLLMGLAVGVLGVKFGIDGLTSTGGPDEVPPGLLFFFGGVALLASLGDIPMLAWGIKGTHRLARHLWRMGLAMFIATGSFFLGQAQVFPQPIRSSGLLGLPVLAVVLLTIYWLVRVLFTKWQPRASL